MKAFFGGGEVPVYRELMYERGVLHQSINYVSHRRRVMSTDWLIADHFPADVEVFVDSGARTFNRPGVEVTGREIEEIASDYYRFVDNNIDRIAGYLEFDARQLEDAKRDARLLYVDPNKGIVVWHAEDGLDELERLCSNFSRVAVAEKSLDDESLTPVYRRLARETQLHLIGSDKSLLVPSVAWSSCHFSTWISAQQRGETFIWAGHELRRYEARHKESARRKHRALFESLGLDVQKIQSDDATENLKLSLWSWTQHFASLDRGAIADLVTLTPAWASRENAETAPTAVAGTDLDWENDRVTTKASKPREEVTTPGLETVEHTVYYTDPEDGSRRSRTELRVTAADSTFLRCDGCMLSKNCPAYSPGEECSLFTGIEAGSKEQREGIFNVLIALEAKRVLRGHAAEESEGGYLDKTLSAEIDRLARLLKQKSDMEQSSFTLSIKAKNGGEVTQTGLLTRLFGSGSDTPSQPALGSDQRTTATQIVEDAEVISDVGDSSGPVTG